MGVEFRFQIEIDDVEICMTTFRSSTGQEVNLGCGTKIGRGPIVFRIEEVFRKIDECPNNPDVTGRFTFRGKSRGCDWVFNQYKTRCKFSSLMNRCQESCDKYFCYNYREEPPPTTTPITTCSNKRDSTGTFFFKGRNRSCNWVKKKRRIRCRKRKFRTSCQTTCDFNGCKKKKKKASAAAAATSDSNAPLLPNERGNK